MDNDDLRKLAEWLRKCKLEKSAEAFERFVSIVCGVILFLTGSRRQSATLC